MQWGERWQWRQSHRPRELTQRSYGEAGDIGLQSRCSILLGLSTPLAVPGHSSVPDPHRAGYLSINCAGHTMLEYPPLAHATRLMTTGIPTTSLHWTSAWSWYHSLPGYLLLPQAHCPSDPAEPQPRMGRPEPTPPIRPCLAQPLCGTTGALPC
jgi:hypothetical protein